MSEPYLIVHKVRGEPAFDVAEKMDCPICAELMPLREDNNEPEGCPECNQCGYWWIIPTSGHRAYPYWVAHFSQIDFDKIIANNGPIVDMPSDLPDHYPPRHEPAKASQLASLLEALPPAKPTYGTFKRRF